MEPIPGAWPGNLGAYEIPAGFRSWPAATERPGLLRLGGGQLVFLATDGEALIDAPTAQLHSMSLAEMNTAMDIWQGSQHYRIVFPSLSSMRYWPAGAVEGVGGLAAIDTIVAGTHSYLGQKEAARAWRDLLSGQIGEPPPDIRIHAPHEHTVALLRTLAAIVILVALAYLALGKFTG